MTMPDVMAISARSPRVTKAPRSVTTGNTQNGYFKARIGVSFTLAARATALAM